VRRANNRPQTVRPNVRYGSNHVILTLLRQLPVYSDKQTIPEPVGTSHSCQTRKSPRSFDHLVGALQQRCRHFDAERLGGLEVYDQFELGRLLDRQVGWLRTLKNLVNEDGGPTI